MARDFYPCTKAQCYTCIQWEGNRSLSHADKKIKVDLHEEGNCLIWHKKMRANKTCDQHHFLVF